jgi:general secretion pathway protein D
MCIVNQLSCIALVILLVLPGASRLEGRNKKGDKYLAQGKAAEVANDWPKAFEFYDKALKEDPGDTLYLMNARRARFQAGQVVIQQGQKARAEGNLTGAMELFLQAFALDPASSMAEQEIRRTKAMIERQKQKGPEAEKEEKGLTPAQAARKDAEERISSVKGAPELRPISRQIASLKMSNQPVKVLFETVGKLAGINVLFDSEYQSQNKNFTVDLTNTTLEEALDYVAVLTRSYWKPLSSNTIFVTNDNVTKRRDYEDNVVKVFYLQNITSVQELQEIATAVRSVTEIRRLFTYNAQNAILVRGTVDQVTLAEKLLQDLDKPKSEVVVDVIVMEAARGRTRDLAAAIASGGTPGIKTSITPNFGTSGSGEGSSGSAGTIALDQLNDLGWEDFSITLPSYILSAVMSDRSTRVRQNPQLRAADGQKASIRIGDRVPTASGSFAPGIGTIGVSPLVNTQFQFIDVGVNADITPRIHGSEEISMHVEIEVSSVRDKVNLGGIEQPIIGQRKVIHDVRVREGEFNLIGGLLSEQETRALNGIPLLSQLPVVKWFFSSESVERNNAELLIVLLPRIVRSPEITPTNLRGVAAGNDQTVKLSFVPRGADTAPAKPVAGEAPAAPGPAAVEVSPAEPKPSAPKPATAAKPANLMFTPMGVVTKQGSPVIVTLQVQNAEDLMMAPARIKFDPKMLRLAAVTPGVFLSSDGQKVNFTEKTQNDTGEAAVTLNRLPGASGVSGSGALITFTFQAIGQGKSMVTVNEIDLKNSQMQQIPAELPKVEVVVQ